MDYLFEIRNNYRVAKFKGFFRNSNNQVIGFTRNNFVSLPELADVRKIEEYLTTSGCDLFILDCNGCLNYVGDRIYFTYEGVVDFCFKTYDLFLKLIDRVVRIKNCLRTLQFTEIETLCYSAEGFFIENYDEFYVDDYFYLDKLPDGYQLITEHLVDNLKCNTIINVQRSTCDQLLLLHIDNTLSIYQLGLNIDPKIEKLPLEYVKEFVCFGAAIVYVDQNNHLNLYCVTTQEIIKTLSDHKYTLCKHLNFIYSFDENGNVYLLDKQFTNFENLELKRITYQEPLFPLSNIRPRFLTTKNARSRPLIVQ